MRAVEPLDRATIWPYVDGAPQHFYYSRNATPNVESAERALGALDGGEAVLFPSGTAAGLAVALCFLDPGARVALGEGIYYGTGALLGELRRFGIEHELFDQTGAPPAGVDLVWVEAPSNPFLTMPDLAAATASGASVLCDSTASTPLHLRPLEHGCRFALHSATKYLAGHHDALAGVVVCGDPADAERLRAFRSRTGIVCAPEVAWLVERGLETLEVRVARQTASARVIAERLAAHEAVTTVRYPGFGGLLSFDIADGDAARRLETSTTRIANATSLGGTRSTLETRHRWEGDRCPPGLVRLSVGLEDPDELWHDLARALATAVSAR
jgi:cystathionine gamma-synthase